MPKMFIPVMPMNLDKGPLDGDHTWVVKDLLWTSRGLDGFPVPEAEIASISVTSGHLPITAITWMGEGSERIYYATTGKIFELSGATATDVSRASGAYTSVVGSFAAYGNKCYFSNGVDRINSITVPSAVGGTLKFTDMTYITSGTVSSVTGATARSTSAVIAPKYICSHKNHLIGANIKMLSGYSAIDTATTAVGSAFTNQPAGGNVEVRSSNAGDTTQTVTVLGTLTGTDTVKYSTIALNGTTWVAATAGSFGTTTWGKIMRVHCSAANAGNVTVRTVTGSLTVATLPIAGAASFVGNNVVSLPAGDTYVTLVASAAETGQVGLIGTDTSGTVQYDSQALNGTTTVTSNLKFRTVTAIATGDIGGAVTVTASTFQFGQNDTYEHLVWISGTDLPEGWGDPQVAPELVGSDYRWMYDGLGKITGIVDGGDCFFVFKSGSITRFDGPPFQPTVLSYTVGMVYNTNPYKQGNKIYFWSQNGLCSLNINTNEIVELFVDRFNRSVIDWSNFVRSVNIGLFPKQNSSTVEMKHAAAVTNKVSISGDSRYGLVFLVYESGVVDRITPNIQMLCYNVELDMFFIVTGPPGVAGSYPIAVEYFDEQVVTSTFPVSALRVIYVTSTPTVHKVYKWSDSSVENSVSGSEPYVRWPFKSVDPSSSRSRIISVRPMFDNASTALLEGGYTLTGTKIEILSISGTGKTWVTQSVLSTSQGTTSANGWWSVDHCPFADKHSIGIHIDATSFQAAKNLRLMNLIGIEVQFELMPSRSI